VDGEELIKWFKKHYPYGDDEIERTIEEMIDEGFLH